MSEDAMETPMEDVATGSDNNSEHNGDNPREIELEVETCRLCDELGDKMYNIFDENPEGYQLIGLIKENLPIVLYKSDPLSKQVCEKCVEGLQIISSLKKRSRNTQEKYVEKLKNEADTHDKNVLLFLGCTGSKLMNNGENEDDEEDEELKDECTSTDDLTVLCANCKTAILDASTVNGEVELGADLHKIIAESLRKNKVITGDSETEKVLRKRKIQPIYQELDDSLCSSLTDLTRRTAAIVPGDDESSQFASDMDSEESVEERPSKRKKFDSESKKIQEEINEALAKRKELPAEEEEEDEAVEGNVDPVEAAALEPEKVIDYVEMFEQEPEYTYEPLSLLRISLNAINAQNVEEYYALPYVKKSAACKCNTCGEGFKNMKLLALHEFHHMDVDMEEKIDNPLPWPEDHPYANVRNKWLTYFDENGYDEDDIVIDNSLNMNREETSLLVEKSEKTMDVSNKDEVVLVNMKPMVNGIYLGDYTKEERKMFYQCMRIGGQTKRFCPLCRYCFKDNWAIESHYFSSACHYTCRYCGMRFNKQRHRFDEHVQKHKDKDDPVSDKIFTASKINNTMPKIIQPNKVRRIVQVDPEQPREIKLEEFMPRTQMTQTDGRMRQMGPYGGPGGPNAGHGFVKIKEEPKDFVNAQNKSQNQAYFCRKCYKVFFKLDEFNAHSKSCDYNQFHTSAPPYRGAPETASPTPRAYQNNTSRTAPNDRRSNGEYTSTGRPIRNCVKDIGPYTDEVYIPKQLLNETVANPAQGFICHICGTPFPTIYSRNSHMRIHKGELGGPGSNMMMAQPPQNNILKQRLQQQQHMQRAGMHQKNMYQNPPKQQNNYPQFEEIKIKQEPVDSFEPMVEIHEGHEEPPSPPQRYNAGPQPPRELGGGAVSITPINKSGTGAKQNLNPNIMKLVQNNPNISISKRPSDKPQRHSTGNFSRGGGNYNGNASYQGPQYPATAYSGPPNTPPANVDDRSYKCSSCWEAFSNKSHLYFHKKNQCEGSRFPCPFCKKRFGTEAAYSSHIFYSHPE
ncbi:uncharacterized protein LOC143203630 isoform X1 [Rhynchophorus ferrugineus]|uniref:uncharacterized protein LOC143203630 isoform X1 n=1 Tax=Rhynchophorus ferrugineus TaxID=354439 RepID=UPI003FCD1F9D